MNTHHVLNVSNCNEEERSVIMWSLIFGIVLACTGTSSGAYGIVTYADNMYIRAFAGFLITTGALLIAQGLQTMINSAAC